MAAATRGGGGEATCSECGKGGGDLQRCSTCKQTWYCGAQCQKAGWKRHKKTCVPLKEVRLETVASMQDVWGRLSTANNSLDWPGVLKWEGRLDELMAYRDDAGCDEILGIFIQAHSRMAGTFGTTGFAQQHSVLRIKLEERRVDLLGKMGRFCDQGKAICAVAESLSMVQNNKKAKEYFQRARALGEQHGFFTVECTACQGLGQLSIAEGRTEEGVELLRHALAAANLEFSGEDGFRSELLVLHFLSDVLFKTNAIDEIEALVPRYRKAARADARRRGLISSAPELNSLCVSARVNEVTRLLTLSWELLPHFPPGTVRR